MPTAVAVLANDDALSVELSDGRTITVPIAWYPRLVHGSAAERTHWRLIAGGRGIHWPELDEDISVDNLLVGRPSAESQVSFKRWLRGHCSRLASSSTEAERRRRSVRPR